MQHPIRTALTICLASVLGTGLAAANAPYRQHENIVYAEAHGIGLVLDIFVPTGRTNGLGLIDVVSGGWSSSRGKINDHKKAQLFDIFCARGYTVFAIRPGSVSKFTGLEMRDNLQRGIRWVEQHAGEYGVDAQKFGVIGASAGGHLACLAAVASSQDSPLAAVGVFFPPTDLIEFAGGKLDLHADTRMAKLLGNIAFNGRLNGVTAEQARKTLTELSPARLVTGKEPPFLLIHGDADTVVPLAQSERMVSALQDKGVAAKLIVKPGGAHPWPTIHEEVAVIADWMDEQLEPTPVAETPAFTREFDIIYHKDQGFAVTMEKVAPTQHSNRAAVVMVMSGGWFSNHDSTRPHDPTKLPNAFRENAVELLERGYTLFYVVHGTQPKFNIREIHEQLSNAIRYIRFYAGDFDIDPDRIGISGASAGGHLSLMQGMKGEERNEDETGVLAMSSKVQAVAAYFPPTDFVNYGNDGIFFDKVVREVLNGKNPFLQALDLVEFDAEAIRLNKIDNGQQLAEHYEFIAPAYHVTGDDAPTLLLHGDADKLVPIQQSELMVEKLEQAGVPHKLYLKEGGNHGWPSIPAEAKMIADWFDLHLAP